MNQINLHETNRVFHAAPFIRDLGVQLVSISAGECETLLPLSERHLQQDGFVHAGVQATIADHTAGTAASSLLDDGQQVLSAEFKINLLRSAKGAFLRCHAKVLKPGASLMVVEAEVFCGELEQWRLVSKTTVTLAVVKPRKN